MQLLHLKVILAAIDVDEASATILQAASELATTASARLHVVHVATSVGAADAARQLPRGERESTIRGLLENAGVSFDDLSVHLPIGDPASAIRSLADWVRADVIVLGRHRDRATAHREMGCTALRAVTSSWAPCLILSRPLRLPLERVLAPVDLSETSQGALGVALSWASALRGAGVDAGATGNDAVSLTALYIDHSTELDGAPRQSQALEDALARLRHDAGAWAGVGINGALVGALDVPLAIAEYATEHQSDLVVLGTRGLGLDDVGRLGGVSLEVARRLDAPLLLVPPAMWSTHTVER